jgi:cytochrome P450
MRHSIFADDLLSPAATEDPYAYFGAFRERGTGIHWASDIDAWLVTRHQDVVSIVRNQDSFSSAVSFAPDPPCVKPPIDQGEFQNVEYMRAAWQAILNFDRPEHLLMRKAIHRWFTPRAVERWRAEIRKLADGLIDRQMSAGGMEVIRDFAVPIPLHTLSVMMGVPAEDAPTLHELSARVLASGGTEPDRFARCTDAWHEMEHYFAPLLASRRGPNAGEDLVSLLAAGENEGAYTRQQCLSTAIFLMIAGHETTLNVICNGVVAYARNPEQWSQLRRDLEGIGGLAAEECLRYEPTVKGIFRIARADTAIGDVEIRAGDHLFLVIAAANRDPRVFDEPDLFSIARDPNPHVTFSGGIHHCLGAALARIEIQEAFGALARKVPKLVLEPENLEYVPSVTGRTPCSVNVRWSDA